MSEPKYEQTWRCQMLAAIGGERCEATVTHQSQHSRLPAGWYRVTFKRRPTDGEARQSGERMRKTRMAVCPECAEDLLDRVDHEVARSAVPFGKGV